MFSAFGITLLAAFLLSSAELPDIAGQWSGEDWGTVILKQTNPGEYSGSYAETVGARAGTIQLKWSEIERRFNGTWRLGEDRFGELSVKLVGDEIRGAQATDPKCPISNAHARLADLTWIRGYSKAAPPQEAALIAPAEPLDLTGSYQTKASQFDRITAYPWRAVPRGPKTLGNVPLAIGGMICLWGETNASSGLVFPEKVNDIPVSRKFDTLYVYHSTFNAAHDGSPVYHLTLWYENGTSSMTTICYGAQLRDWWQTPNERVSELTDSRSKMVWREDSPDSKVDSPVKLRFFITSITNPRPALGVKSISLVSAKGKSTGCILAMTTGPANLLKVDKLNGK